MFQNPVLQQELARDRCKAVEQQMQIDPRPVESVLDSIVRRLKQAIGLRSLNPLARGAS